MKLKKSKTHFSRVEALNVITLAFCFLIYAELCNGSEATSELSASKRAVGGAILAPAVIVVDDLHILSGIDPFSPNWTKLYQYQYCSDNPLKIDGDNLGRCMALATLKSAKKVSYNHNKMKCQYKSEQTEKWSDMHPAQWPSELEYLAADDDRACDFVTTTEGDLQDWIMNQPDNSIDPLSLYAKSIELNQGNIWNAVLAIHQVLRTAARHWEKPRYWSDFTPETAKTLYDKFIDIRGDLKERGNDFHGDHRGSWYRIWGAMLYRMSFFDDESEFLKPQKSECCSDDPNCTLRERKQGWNQVKDLIANLTSILVFFADEVILKGASEEDKGKLAVDIASGKAGGSLLNGISDSTLASSNDEFWNKCLARDYLQPKIMKQNSPTPFDPNVANRSVEPIISVVDEGRKEVPKDLTSDAIEEDETASNLPK